jgi:beta-N-acetylhexosaminidase
MRRVINRFRVSSVPSVPLWPRPRRTLCALCVSVAASLLCISVVAATPATPETDPTRWVEKTLASLTLDEKIAQLVVPSLDSTYLATDTDEYARLADLVTSRHVGGFIVFGATEVAPPVLLNPTYGTVILGQPLEAAATLNRLQRLSKLPLLNAADFEFGVGMRIAGGTQFPRAMAFGATGDPDLAEQAARIVGEEARALGIHVDFAPVADVNNNPRNPVINTRSFGEDPTRVGVMAAAFVRGLRAGGVLATLKHFPGHGDTDTDTHLGLAVIPHDRARLDSLELVPFKAGIGAGADAVMIAHVELPKIDPAEEPATFSRPTVTGLLREGLGFRGLVFTDSMSMAAVAKLAAPGDGAARAIEAGADVVLHSPDPAAAITGVAAAVGRGDITAARIDESVRRVLDAKTRLGLQTARFVDLEAIAAHVGGRAHRAVAQEVSERSMTLVKDSRQQLPLRLPREKSVLLVSVLDYPGGWRIASPGRTFLPALKDRWPNSTAIEISDRTTPGERDLVRSMAPKFDAIVLGIYVRTASGSGRMDLSSDTVRLVESLAALGSAERPVIAAFFGNPYVAASVADLPAMLLTYDFGDLAESSAARAIAGEIPIGGHLPIGIPGVAAAGEGLTRPLR